MHCVGVPLQDVFKVFDEYNVSAHYLVPQITGTQLQTLMPEEFSLQTLLYPDSVPVIHLVDDSKKAFHASVSKFSNFNSAHGCDKGLNAGTIGIEFHAPNYGGLEEEKDWYQFVPYTESQKATGIKLISHLVEKHDIPKINLLAHSTIAVGRKTDPGPLFFWNSLYENGFGYMPRSKEAEADIKSVAWIQKKLSDIGFTGCPQTGVLDDSTSKHIDAYIMQFAPNLWAGQNTPVTPDLVASMSCFEGELRL